jgi:hypothetical protein
MVFNQGSKRSLKADSSLDENIVLSLAQSPTMLPLSSGRKLSMSPNKREVRRHGRPLEMLLKEPARKNARSAQALLPPLPVEEMEARSSSFVFR